MGLYSVRQFEFKQNLACCDIKNLHHLGEINMAEKGGVSTIVGTELTRRERSERSASNPSYKKIPLFSKRD